MKLERQVVFDQLRRYIVDVLLEGNDIGLDASTRLMDWGLVNSFELLRLIRFIEERFDVSVPSSAIDHEKFATLDSLTDHVLSLEK